MRLAIGIGRRLPTGGERRDEGDGADRVRRDHVYLVGAGERERSRPEPAVPERLLRARLELLVLDRREHDPVARLDGGGHLRGVRELERRRDDAACLGAKLVGYYLTMGQYDAIAISEAPDDHTIAKLALAACARGNVRTETMRAFTDEEARKIATELSES